MADTYSTLRDDFQWHVPRGLNIALDCCLKWAQLPAHDNKVAVTWRQAATDTQQITFGQLGQLVCQLANGMQKLGVIPGDRVMVLLGRPIEALAVTLACWATGAVAVPLSPHADYESIVSKIKHARGRLIFIDDKTEAIALEAIARCPRIQQTVGIGVYHGNVMNWRGLIARQSTHFEPVQSLPSDPALMIWPESVDLNVIPGSALLLAQQSLVGNLPGFVMTTNWFPQQASGLLTTLLPWDEAGLLAAILPALYFGHPVTIDQRVEFAVTEDISHVITTPTRWCQWLKPRLAATTTAVQPLRAVTLFGHDLAPFWQEITEQQVATIPNLALYLEGCGLALGQNNERWPDPAGINVMRVTPGFDVEVLKTASDTSESDTIGLLSVARFDDRHGHPNPAQYVQIWPLKESLDGTGLAPPPLWFETTWLAETNDAVVFDVYEPPNPPLTLGPRQLSVTVVEQLLLQIPTVADALVITSPQKKASRTPAFWILLQIHHGHQVPSAIIRHELEETVPGLILDECGYRSENPADWPSLRVGVVSEIERTYLDQPRRHVWTKRAKFNEIDFLMPARHSL